MDREDEEGWVGVGDSDGDWRLRRGGWKDCSREWSVIGWWKKLERLEEELDDEGLMSREGWNGEEDEL